MNFNPKKISLIVTDLDGTLLLPDSTLGKKTVSVIKACKKRSLKIMLATGRSLLSAEDYRKELELEGPMIYYNGAELVDMPSGRCLSLNTLPNEVAIFCTQLAREYNIHFHVYWTDKKNVTEEILFSESPSASSEIYTDRTGLHFNYGDLIDKLNAENHPDCIKGLFIAQETLLEELRSKILSRFGSAINIVKSASTFLEVLNSGASKGAALQQSLSFFNISREAVLAFGDEENDITMLQTAGYAVAPSNAIEPVKKTANHIIGHHGEEALAAFLEEHFL
ncbi:MAG: Cof-type HAD-IIB family hydrolase [Spirochaetaceae bacterium]|jgi:Cof subfamily protein (haloacid dehalogenase superfamily)|nr:Cof-type HAD-IIB family hydrolase [Spirochaetaceae bacterium]GMO19173.1 MAG: sugar-phosphatase [Termitinemataceae bacterium]